MATLADRATRVAFRAKIVEISQAQVGYKEGPDNDTKYGRWFGLNGHPWCAIFISWVYAEAAKAVGCENPLVNVQTRKGFAGVTSSFEVMRRRGWVLEPGELKMPGDIVCWDHDSNPGGPGHTGIVVAPFRTIEGNTNATFSRTGGMVREHEHFTGDTRHGRLLGFVRPTRRYGR